MLRLLVLGDSLSEGVGDPAPGGPGWREGRLHGWVHHLAEQLEADGVPVDLESHAHRGATVGDVLALQWPAVRGDRYDVVAMVVGANDAQLLPFRPARFAAELEEAVGRAQQVAPVVMLGTLHDLTRHLPMTRAVRARLRSAVAALNDEVRRVADRYDVAVLDLAAMSDRIERAALSVDRLHPNRQGHAYLAAEVRRLLAEAGAVPPGPPPELPAGRQGSGQALLQVGWLLRHAAVPSLREGSWRRRRA